MNVAMAWLDSLVCLVYLDDIIVHSKNLHVFFYSIFSIAVFTVAFMLFKIIFYRGSGKCLR